MHKPLGCMLRMCLSDYTCMWARVQFDILDFGRPDASVLASTCRRYGGDLHTLCQQKRWHLGERPLPTSFSIVQCGCRLRLRLLLAKGCRAFKANELHLLLRTQAEQRFMCS